MNQPFQFTPELWVLPSRALAYNAGVLTSALVPAPHGPLGRRAIMQDPV